MKAAAQTDIMETKAIQEDDPMKNTELVNRFFDAQNQRDRAACSGLVRPPKP